MLSMPLRKPKSGIQKVDHIKPKSLCPNLNAAPAEANFESHYSYVAPMEPQKDHR